jgi:hypothetical protein
MEQRQTFNQQLVKWTASYVQANDKIHENDAFRQIHTIVRDMETQKILKPLIFYQIMMALQALTCVMGIELTEPKIKKIFAILYPDDNYVSDLTKQVISAIGISFTTMQLNLNNESVLEQLHQQPSVGAPIQKQYQSNYKMHSQYGPPPGPHV